MTNIKQLSCPFCKKHSLFYKLRQGNDFLTDGVSISGDSNGNISLLLCPKCNVVATSDKKELSNIYKDFTNTIKQIDIDLTAKRELAKKNGVPLDFGNIFKFYRRMSKVLLTTGKIAAYLNEKPSFIKNVENGKDFITDKTIAERWLRFVTHHDNDSFDKLIKDGRYSSRQYNAIML